MQKTEPKIGDKRTVPCFAWWPIDCQGSTVWLERILKIQEYKAIRYGSFDGEWANYQWVTIAHERLVDE